MADCIGLLREEIRKNTHDRALPDLDVHRYRHARLQKNFSAMNLQILVFKRYLDRKMIVFDDIIGRKYIRANL